MPFDPQSAALDPKEVGEQFLSNIGLSRAMKEGLRKEIEAGNPQLEKNTKTIDKHSKALFDFKKEQEPIGGSTPEEFKLHQAHELISDHAKNPEDVIDNLTAQLEGLTNKDPALSAAISQSVGQGLGFLEGKRPSTEKKSPLDLDTKLSSSQISDFNKYAKTLDSPFSAFEAIKNGAITPHHIEVLSTAYPSVFNKMKEATMGKLVDFLTKNSVSEIPYKTRLGLSQFLGQNLDSTMSQPSLMANQNILSQLRMQKQQQDAQQMSPSKDGMAKMKSISNDKTMAQQSADRRASRSV